MLKKRDVFPAASKFDDSGGGAAIGSWFEFENIRPEFDKDPLDLDRELKVRIGGRIAEFVSAVLFIC